MVNTHFMHGDEQPAQVAGFAVAFSDCIARNIHDLNVVLFRAPPGVTVCVAASSYDEPPDALLLR
ncbi:MAG: hypothetical protein QOG71_3879 [Pyrinomonadaceae bacterium]|nr:hypothetical protein [Pyrinomonadaceae bacterium]